MSVTGGMNFAGELYLMKISPGAGGRSHLLLGIGKSKKKKRKRKAFSLLLALGQHDFSFKLLQVFAPFFLIPPAEDRDQPAAHHYSVFTR